jgi:O-antigen ligase
MTTEVAAWRPWASGALRAAVEAVVLVLACLAPWPFGAVHPVFESALYAGVAVLAALWAARVLLEWRVGWGKCPALLCLAGLFLLGIGQLVPLPASALAALSPGTVQTCSEFLPTQGETLPDGEPKDVVPRPAGSVVSLAPAVTRRELVQLLAVLVLFAVVRYNLESVTALRRLCVAAAANGTLLAVFALAQFFSSPHDTLYWTFPSQGQVFGPFICRNHFPFYVNVCVGLTAGLLASFLPSGEGRARRGEPLSPAVLLQDPRCLWAVVALAVMVSSVAFSLSRGGVLALAGGGLVGLLARRAGSPRTLATAALLTLFLAVGLLAWFGLPRVEARLGTLWSGDALEEGRLPMWRNALGGVKDFPVWGTGYGTFALVEPMSRQPGDDPHLKYEHAHNDYLEALVEGGLLRLALSLAAVGFVYRQGWRALRRHRGRPGAGLVLGALVGFTTVVLHSAVDFGLHLPAIAFLAAVVAAHLAALGAEPEGEAERAAGWRRLGPVAVAAGCVAVGWVLLDVGWRGARADLFRLEALRARREPGPVARERQIGALEAAAGWEPENDDLRVALAGAYYQAFQEESDSRYAGPALRHYLRARDSCPLLLVPQMRLADLRDHLDGGDPRRAYLERATRLRPSDAEIWYLAGAQELLDGEPDRAWASWRRSLECSEAFLGEIVHGGSSTLGPGAAACGAFPDRPDLLYRAALTIDPGPAREAFLTRALALLKDQPGARQAKELHLEAQVRGALGQPAEALDAYRAALTRDPLQAGWRFEYARLLYQQERWGEAERELRVVLREQPGNKEAQDLLRAVLEGPAGGG